MWVIMSLKLVFKVGIKRVPGQYGRPYYRALIFWSQLFVL